MARYPESDAIFQDRIVRDPKIMVGKPTVKGTRVTVTAVIAHLAAEPDFKALFEAFPSLTMEDIQACLAYAWVQLERQGHRMAQRTLQNRAAG